MVFTAAILNGFGASILWTAQGEYVSRCGNVESKGFFFGYFWSIHQASQILSCVLGGLIFEYKIKKYQFSLIMGLTALVGTSMFLCIQKPFVHNTKLKKSTNLGREEDYFTVDGKSDTMSRSGFGLRSFLSTKSNQSFAGKMKEKLPFIIERDEDKEQSSKINATESQNQSIDN